MKKTLGLFIILAILAFNTWAQPEQPTNKAGQGKSVASPVAATPLDVAKASVAAHGGDSLLKMRSLILKGSADLSFNGQALPAAFSTAISGEKYYFEIISPLQQLKQTFDGTQTYSSVPGFSLPPVTSLGFPLLAKVGETGYVVAGLSDGGKKRKGFRITTPEGFYTDFIIDEKTNQIKSYESKWMDGGDRAITTSVVIDEFQTVDGIVVPKKYSQRFDLGPITAYANFKAKDIKINSTIEESAFTIPKN